MCTYTIEGRVCICVYYRGYVYVCTIEGMYMCVYYRGYVYVCTIEGRVCIL